VRDADSSKSRLAAEQQALTLGAWQRMSEQRQCQAPIDRINRKTDNFGSEERRFGHWLANLPTPKEMNDGLPRVAPYLSYRHCFD
jgi:hypothetical protein